jgi:H+/gluconate symporter-like permease
MFIIVLAIILLLNNSYSYSLFAKVAPYAYENTLCPKFTTSMILSLISALLVIIVVLLSEKKNNETNKEKFFFKVSQPQPPRCPKGYYGKNVKFEYTQPGNQTCTP